MQLHENCDMDFSDVNRPVDNNDDGDDHKERERALLAQLKAKIELRKKQRKKETIATENRTDTDASKQGKVEKDIDTSKQGKVENEPRTEKFKETDIINDETPTDEKQVNVESGRKKKKKKRKLPSSDEEEEPVPPPPQSDVVPGEGFTILGVDHFEKKQKVKRVLPHWLANPSVVSVNLQHLTTTVDEIVGIDPDLVQKLKDNNITHFFPVQCQVIPWILSTLDKPTKYWPRDVCVSAPTGSGKTLAYVIPVIQALKNRVVPHIRALVVLPVQDLAVQVLKVFETYCVGTDLKVTLITGKESFRKEQYQLIRTGLISGPQSLVDIVITTTGRIVDHIKSTPGFSLQHLRFLIIDEADRIMENIKNDWLHHLNKHIQSFSGQVGIPRLNVENLKSIPPPPQKLLFSATLSQDPEKLQQLGLFQPKLFTSVVEGQEVTIADPEGRGDFIGKYTTPAELSEMICAVTPTNKPLVLYHMMSVNKYRHVLCFTDSQQAAHRLAILLTHMAEGQFRVSEISAALNSSERKDILAKFKDEEIDILVSTNALARGIDIPIVDYVISYSAPKYIKNYIHRIGRTGRAGRKGTAITFVLNKEKEHFKRMVKSAGKSAVEDLFVTDAQLEPYLDDYHQAIEQMKHDLEREQSETLKESKEEKRSRKPKRKIKQNVRGSKISKVDTIKR